MDITSKITEQVLGYDQGDEYFPEPMDPLLLDSTIHFSPICGGQLGILPKTKYEMPHIFSPATIWFVGDFFAERRRYFPSAYFFYLREKAESNFTFLLLFKR